MKDIMVRGVSEAVISELDKITKTEHYSSRNQLISEILELYTASHSSLFRKAITPVVSSLCFDAINKQNENNEHLVNLLLPLMTKILKSLDDIRAIFSPELEDICNAFVDDEKY